METETGDVFGVARSLRVYVTGCKKTQKNRYARLDDHRPEEDRSPSFLLVLVLVLVLLPPLPPPPPLSRPPLPLPLPLPRPRPRSLFDCNRISVVVIGWK